jgi:MtaA/CmuA family methyltransferase
MNHYDRYMATVRREPVDLLPRLPILMQFAAEYIGSNYGEFASDYRVLVEANMRCIADFDFEQVSAISDPYRETQGFGAEIIYVEDGVPRCPNPPLADTKELSALEEPDPLGSERMLDRINALTEFEEEAGGRYSILGWIEGPAAEAADLRGVTNFLMDLMTDEPFACELMDRCIEVGIAFARAQLEAGADTIGIGDAIASQISPDVYEKLIQPREKQLVDAIHEAGGLVRLHICGNITHLLPGISKMGVDILDFDHMVDARTVREAVGTGTVIAGNIDPAGAVKGGESDAIRKYMQDVYAAVGNPFMVTAGCEVPPGTPNENLKALCEPIPYVA